MPRMADQGLEKRILRAAQHLWHSQGDKGLTLRAVARRAGTTTTTVYKRFRNKDALRAAMARDVDRQIGKAIRGATTIEEVYRRYLQFARQHPREYKMISGAVWTELMGPDRPRPVQDWLQSWLAARFGGQPQDYAGFFHALFLLMHGAASLLTVSKHRAANKEIEENCVAICDLLIKNIEIFQPRESSNSSNSSSRTQDRLVL